MKKIKDFDKNEKKMLLKAIATGEIDRKTLTPETLIAIKRGDLFACIMRANGNEGINIICLGDVAKAERKLFDSFVERKELNFDLIESSGLYRCREDGKELSEEQIKAMEPDYLMNIEIVDDMKEPPSGYMLIPKTKEDFINGLSKI